jgi:hypothetical protein
MVLKKKTTTYKRKRSLIKTIELSVTLEKHSTGTLSLVIHRVSLQKKSTLAFKGG